MPLVLLLARAASATVVPGGAYGNTTWDLAGSPWIIQGDVTVLAGATLTIDPGVEVRFASSDAAASGLDASRVELIVDGHLDVQGDPADPVDFLADTSVSSGTWYGIVVDGSATITHATLQHASYGVRSGGTLDVTGLDLSHNSSAGVYVTGGSATLTELVITGSSYGIHATGMPSVFDLSHSVIHDTTSHGVYVAVSGSPSLELDHVTIHSVSSSGVYVSGGSPAVNVTNSIVTKNSSYGVYEGSGTVTVSYTDAWDNGGADLSGVTQGAGILKENPLYVSAPTNFALTSNSPARFAASDSTDLGARPYVGDATPGLYGTLWADLVLPAGTHPVAGDLTVPAGVTLTLQPGVVFEAATSDFMEAHLDAGRVELRVLGTLEAGGDPADPVAFTSSGSSSGSWYGVHLLSGATGWIADATIEEASYGVHHQSVAGFPISGTAFDRNATAGVYLDGGALTATDLVITGSSYGIHATGTPSLDLSHSVIHDTTSHGVYVAVSGSPSLELDHVTIHSVSSSGVYVSGGSPAVNVTNSIVTKNSSYGVYEGSGTVTVSYTDAWDNGGADLSGVTQGAGILKENPLYVSAPTNFALTSNSPARFAASDNTDLGARPYVGDATPGLYGTLWTDTVLNAGTHTVAGDLTVPVGVTLTLNPGAVLEAATSDLMEAHLEAGRVEVRIAGTIFSLGTVANPVTLRSSGSSAGSWYGLHLLSTANTSIVEHTRIEEAAYGIRYDAVANNPLRDLVLERNSTAGVYLTAGAPPIDRIEVRDSSYGVWITSAAAPSVSDSLVEDTTSHGIYVNVSGSPTIDLDHLTIHSVSSSGVYVSGGSPSVNLTDSIVTKNSSYGVYEGSGTVTVSYTNAWDNGSTNLSGVTQGSGNMSVNPLFVAPGSDFALTEWSPARFAASDGGDLGAFPYDGDPTVGLQGTLWGGLTLDLAGSPYTLVGDVTVPAGDTLVIEPGVSVLAATTDSMEAHLDAGRVELRIAGILEAEGTPYERISLASTGSSTGSWYGLHLLAGSDGLISYVDVEEATYGIRHSTSIPVPLSFVHAELNSTAAIYVDAGTPQIDGLIATGSTYGLWLSAGGSAVLTNAVIHDTTSHGVYVSTSGSPTVTIDSSTVHSCSGSGIYVNAGTPVVNVTNTLSTENSSYGVYEGAGTVNVSYTDAWGNGSANLSGVTQGAGNLAVNPFYLDAPNRNLRLSAGSPAIDAGTAVGAPDHDAAGLPRPNDGNGVGGAEHDMGAYEYRIEVAGLSVDPSTDVRVDESGTAAILDVVLDVAPLADVIVAIDVDDDTEAVVSPTVLTFTPIDWNVAQQVEVTGVDDAVDDGEPGWSLTFDPAGSVDLEYQVVDVVVLPGATTDDDTAGLVLVGAEGLATTEAGGQDTFTVALASEPVSDVRLDLSSTDTAEATVSPPAMTFTPANWATPRTVTVTGADDATADGGQAFQVILDPALSTDLVYAALTPAVVDGTNDDDETVTPGVTITGGPLATTEAGGQAAVQVVLDSAPTATVTIPVSSSDPDEATVSPASLVFTTADWSVPQQVTATGVDDPVDDGDAAYTVVLGAVVTTDPVYAAFDPADVPGTNADDDTAGVLVTALAPRTTEAGGVDVVLVRLQSAPTSGVVINVGSSDAAEGAVSPPSLSFDATSWSVDQAITLTGIDDAVDDGDVQWWVTLSLSTADPGYQGIAVPDVVVVNEDDDAAGIVVVGGPLATAEDGLSDDFAVVLASQPTADVVVPLTVDETLEVTLQSSVTFTPSDWDVPQLVPVTGLDDAVADGDVPFLVSVGPATSADSGYAGLFGADVDGINGDDDAAGLDLQPAGGLEVSEAGTQVDFTVALSSEPLSDVTLDLASTDPGEATPSLAQLVFTPADWDVPQVVTVTGVDDAVADGDQPWAIEVVAATSTDPAYDDVADLGIVDVLGVTLDDDGAGYAIVPGAGLVTTEGGGAAVFTVALLSAPVTDVFVVVNSSDPGEGTASPPLLQLDAGNWNVPQLVTVTGVDDAVVDGDQPYAIVLTVATADPLYALLDPADVEVVNLDDDVIVETGDTGEPTETGDTGQPGPGPVETGDTGDTGDTGGGDTDTDVDTDTDSDADTDATNGGAAGDEEDRGCGCGPGGTGTGWLGLFPGLVAIRARRRRAR